MKIPGVVISTFDGQQFATKYGVKIGQILMYKESLTTATLVVPDSVPASPQVVFAPAPVPVMNDDAAWAKLDASGKADALRNFLLGR